MARKAKMFQFIGHSANLSDTKTTSPLGIYGLRFDD